jgi:hypothetical protein
MYRNVIAPLIACAVVAVVLYAYLQHDRYSLLLVERENGFVKAYKIDKNTGKLWWLLESESREVNDRSSRPKTPLPAEERAITLVQNAETGITDAKIRDWLQAKKGVLKVYGWNARKIDDQTYAVAYTYDQGMPATAGAWLFEVNLVAEIVRPIIGDPELEKKYSDSVQNLRKKK